MLVAGFICVAFACGDEYHQSFVSGRSPSKRDVAIDSFGIFWGIILARIVGWTGRKTIFRPFSDEALQKRDEKKARKSKKNMFPIPEMLTMIQIVMEHIQTTAMKRHGITFRIRLHKTDTRHSQEMTIISLSQALILIRVIQTDTHRIRITPMALHSKTAILTRIKPVDMCRIRITLHSKTVTRPYPEMDDDYVPDKLSEDMSFRKLMHDIKDQKQERHNAGKHPVHKSE